MGRLRKRLNESREGRQPTGDVWAKFIQAYPELSEAVLGVATSKGGWELWPHTLMIYNDSGTLKWSLHCKATRESVFGSFPDHIPLIEDIERALSEEKFDVRKKG